jgi:hypothetical protein
MFHIKGTYKLFVTTLLLALFNHAEGQFISKIIDYSPAPGQFTNADFIGTPAAAQSLVGTNKGMVSLGAFGGSVTVYFSSGIQNDPANPYGIDFTIYGNSSSAWSEPGIIQVMKDENKNGIPDETWYEIAGSDHYWNSTNFSYEVTYLNNNLNQASNIEWVDNLGKTGIVPENSFHQQPYYPKADLFPQIPADKQTLKGIRIAGVIDLSNPGVVNSYRRAFGYADNTPVLSTSEKIPDNPYTSAIEGSGGDAIDIGWAMDKNLKPVNLDEIHFIRIYTGMNDIAGWLGEVSTEITGIRDVEPATINGTKSCVVMQDLPMKIILGGSLSLTANVFENGIRQESTAINWTVSNTDLAVIENGQLKSKKSGSFLLRAISAANPAIYTEKEIGIIEAGKAVITGTTTGLKVNDKLELSGKLTDQSGNILTGISPKWRSGNESVAEIISYDRKYYLRGKLAGKTWLYLEAAEIKLLPDSLLMEVLPESALKKVFLSVKTNENTIIPRQSVWVDQFELTPKVDHAQKKYGLQEINFVSLAHAIASAFKNTDLTNEWAFRDDAEGGLKLYLWKVPEKDEGSIVYTFGYGGSQTAESTRKTWVVMLNQQQIVNGFDQIKINNNDEILIYHLADNSLPWTVSHLTSETDSVKTNQPIEIQLKQYSCAMDASRNVAVNSSEAIANQKVKFEAKDQPIVSLSTDEFGKATFTTTKSGGYLITSGIDAARLWVEPITGVHSSIKNQLSCKVYPNPVTEFIRIDSPFPIQSVEIFNTKGVLVCVSRQANIDLSAIPSGVYAIRVNTNHQIFQQKIVKK